MGKKQSNLIDNPYKQNTGLDKQADLEVNQELEDNIPTNYVPVELDSDGKLGAPKKLNFRNFSMGETNQLALIKDNESLGEAIVKCLNEMVYQRFDCKDLTEPDIIKILMTIKANFSPPVLKGMAFYIDEDLEDYKKNKKENIGYVDLHIGKDLKTHLIPKEFKEPIRITDNLGTVWIMRYPRMRDLFYAKKYISATFKRQIEDFSDFAPQYNHNIQCIENSKFENLIKLDETRKEDYEEFLTKKQSKYMEIIESRCILGKVVDDKDVIFDEDERLKEFYNVGMEVWDTLNNIQENYKYGLDEEVSFKSSYHDGEKIKRRFPFQFVHFISSNEQDKSKKTNFSFG